MKIRRRILLKTLSSLLLGFPKPAKRHVVLSSQNKRSVVRVPVNFYQHFDADFSMSVPEEAFGGWIRDALEFDLSRIAVVSMHAWEMGSPEVYPGWWRAAPWAKRAQGILSEVFPRLFAAVRSAGVPLLHVVSSDTYYVSQPGYRKVSSLNTPASPQIDRDPELERLRTFRQKRCFPSEHNLPDIERGFRQLGFPAQAMPRAEEGVAEDGEQLFAHCQKLGVNHLVYCGFAVDGCLLLSPGGMADMQRYGFICSVIPQATTAIENRETARNELCKRIALWRVALAYGFVIDLDDFLKALES